jgi:hypothetical protein
MKKTALALALIFGILQGCKLPEDKNSTISPIVENSKTDVSEDGLIEIGNKTEDPHVLRHMQKALKELVKADNRFSKVVLKPNYKYVKITPLNDQGIEDINALIDLNVYHYPLDYEIKKHGQKYNEPDKDSNFQSFWLVAPINFKFSANIKEKFIEEVFMPFGTGKDEFTYDKETENIYRAIEEKANLNLYPKSKKAKVTATYSGLLAVEDDTISQIKYGFNSSGFYNNKVFLPLRGITIKARNLLTTNTTTTSNSGNFIFSRNWLNSVDEFTIVWESTDFYLENASGNAAITSYTTGISNTWTPNFSKASKVTFRYAHIFRGAHYYYNLPSGDIMSPPRAGIIQTLCNLRSQVAIRVRDGNQSTTRGINSAGCNSNVVIENTLPSNTEILTDAGYNFSYPTFKGFYMFASIVHELTHLKHWAMSGGMTDAKYCLGTGGKGSLAESYALMGEYYLVNKEYSNLILPPYLSWNSDYFDRESYQKKTISYWGNSTSSCSYHIYRYYTPYFIDLIDNRNQSLEFSTYPDDRVSGYTAKFLEDCIKASPDDWYAINAKIKTPNASSPFLIEPSTAQGNTYSNIDYLYDLYKSL